MLENVTEFVFRNALYLEDNLQTLLETCMSAFMADLNFTIRVLWKWEHDYPGVFWVHLLCVCCPFDV